MHQFQAFESTPEVLTIIETALREGGGKMHAFLSGGGLRVVSIDVPPPAESHAPASTSNDDGEQLGYGEHPHVHEALRILADDLRAGGRPYSEVYGRTETHYLTGASTPQDDLDAWLRGGHTFDARFDAANQTFVFELVGLEMATTPPDIVERAATKGETVRWTDNRGIRRVASPSRFPNGEPCCCVQVEARPEGMTHHRADMWYAKRTGAAPTLAAAIRAAFAAPKIEISDPR